MKIRRARKGDIEKLWPIEVESRIYHKRITPKRYLRLNKSKINEKAKLEFIKDFNEYLKNKKTVTLVAEEGSEIIGYVSTIFGKWRWSDNPPKAVLIEDIGVLKIYRKKGVATKLLKEIEKIAKSKKVYYFRLTVWLKNKLAYNFYKKNKYEDYTIEMVKRIK